MSSSDEVIDATFAGWLTTSVCVVVAGDCVIFTTVTGAELVVVVVVTEPEAAVTDVLEAGVLKRFARAASLIVVDEVAGPGGGSVNGLRRTTDVEAVSNSAVTVTDSE